MILLLNEYVVPHGAWLAEPKSCMQLCRYAMRAVEQLNVYLFVLQLIYVWIVVEHLWLSLDIALVSSHGSWMQQKRETSLLKSLMVGSGRWCGLGRGYLHYTSAVLDLTLQS